MIGTLLDVFEISGRGCVVLVDIESGGCRVGDTLLISSGEWTVIGLEMPNYTPETLKRIQQGWKPPAGLLLRDAIKADLVSSIGNSIRGRSS